jgi:Flp pilus assembly protein TadG
MFDLVRTQFLARIRASRVPWAVRRLLQRQEGSAAVEFGLVAAPFLALTFAIIETALVFFAGQTLETAVAESGRLIMTGQAQAKGFDQATFKNAVCARIFGLFDCQSGMYVDVKTYTNFSDVNMDKPLDADGKFTDKDLNYQPGGPCDIVVVRLFYQWPVYVSLLGFSLQDMAGNKRLLVGTAAFRNEPYGAGGCS